MTQALGLQRSTEETIPSPSNSGLYHRDFFLWTQEQARLLREMRASELDIENVVDEVETSGRSVKREIESRLNVLLVHLLKWRFQPNRRSGIWRATLAEQRSRIARELRENPSLRTYPSMVLGEEYESARRLAAGETDISEAIFPSVCPFSIEQILDPAFYPEAE